MNRREAIKAIGITASASNLPMARVFAAEFADQSSHVLFINEPPWSVDSKDISTHYKIGHALEYMKNRGGPGTIYFQPGSYVLDAPLRVHKMLTIYGPGASFSLAKKRGAAILIADPGLYDANIEGITLDGLNKTRNGILVDQGWNRGKLSLKIKNVVEYGARFFGGVRDIEFTDFNVEMCRVGLQIKGDSRRVVVKNMVVDRWLDRGLSIQGTSSAAPVDISVKHLLAKTPLDSATDANIAVSYGYDLDVMNENIRFEDVIYNGEGHAGITADLIVMHHTKNGLVLEPKLEWGKEYGISLTRGNYHCGVEGGYVHNVDGHCVQLSHIKNYSHHCYAKGMHLTNPGGFIFTQAYDPKTPTFFCGAKIQYGTFNSIGENKIESDTNSMHYGVMISAAPNSSCYKNVICGDLKGRIGIYGVDPVKYKNNVTTFKNFDDEGGKSVACLANKTGYHPYKKNA